MLATIHSSCLIGIRAEPVRVEAQVGRGLPCFEVVGLPDRGVRESRVRVKAALHAIGFTLPPRSLVLNLAPGDVRKAGSNYDLAMALAILAACEVVPPFRFRERLFLGELSLSGELREVPGVLAHLRSAHERGLRELVVPQSAATVAGFMPEMTVRPFEHLKDVIAWLQGRDDARGGSEARDARGSSEARDARGNSEARNTRGSSETTCAPPLSAGHRTGTEPDLAEVRGQLGVKRALEVAAAGGHHLLMVGPPGAGKTMLARRLPGLLPPPSQKETMEIATIAGASGLALPVDPAYVQRPFRAPHHTASTAAIIGGGDPVRPGEVTLAHGGVLFLDELPEFRRDVIESLRITMESGEAVVARARCRVRMPAAPQMIAAMNPCPCGHAGDPKRLCSCGPEQVARYRSRVSGPLLDRFDLQVNVARLEPKDFRRRAPSEPSAAVAGRVQAARAYLAERPVGADLRALAGQADGEAMRLLDTAVERLGISARGYGKALRVARTIAALATEERVGVAHMAEAIQYRCLDRRPTGAGGVPHTADNQQEETS